MLRWLKIGAVLFGAGLVWKFTGVVRGGHELLLLAVAGGVAALLLRFDPDAKAGPEIWSARAAEIAASVGAGIALLLTPAASPHAGTGVPEAAGMMTAVIVVAALGLLGWLARALTQHAPTASILARVGEAWRAGFRAHRTATILTLTAGIAVGVILAYLGVRHAGLFALAIALAGARLRIRDALTRLRTKANVRAALTGVLRGGAWNRPHEIAGDSPVRNIAIDPDGHPERIVLPLPPGFEHSQVEETEDRISARLAEWGLYAVRLQLGRARLAIATRIEPLPRRLRYDGRAAVGGTKVWLGTGMATREHATAEGTRGLLRGEPFDFTVDLAIEPHGLIVGLTRSGKSVAANVLLQQVLLDGGWRVILIDPKTVEFGRYRGRPGVVRVTTTLDEHVAALRDAKDEMERRYVEMDAAGVTDIVNLPAATRPPRLLVLIDEVVELLSKSTSGTEEGKAQNALQGEAMDLIASLLRKARAAGIHVWMAGQRADRAILTGEAQNNLAVKIICGKSEHIERGMVGLQDVVATPGIQGRAVGRTLLLPPSEIQIPYTDVKVDLDRWLPVGGEPMPQAPSTPGAAESEAAQAARRQVDLTQRQEIAPVDPAIPAQHVDSPEQPTYKFNRVEPFAAGQAQAELDRMIGLPGVRREVAELAASVRMEMERQQIGVGGGKINLSHLVFAGDPGTGKTSVARIVGSLLRDVGALPSGHVVETDRGDLVGQYLGQTAPRVAAAFDASEGGILFIDEAYALASGDQFGKEAIDTLVKLSEDRRGRVVVILAGYTNEMDHLLDQNPGLRSRFPTRITFENYTPAELVEIARVMVGAQHRVLDGSAADALPEVVADLPRGKDWGNARSIRVLVDLACRVADTRISGLPSRTRDDLITLTEADLRAAADRYAEGVARVDTEDNAGESADARLQRLTEELLAAAGQPDDQDTHAPEHRTVLDLDPATVTDHPASNDAELPDWMAQLAAGAGR